MIEFSFRLPIDGVRAFGEIHRKSKPGSRDPVNSSMVLIRIEFPPELETLCSAKATQLIRGQSANMSYILKKKPIAEVCVDSVRSQHADAVLEASLIPAWQEVKHAGIWFEVFVHLKKGILQVDDMLEDMVRENEIKFPVPMIRVTHVEEYAAFKSTLRIGDCYLAGVGTVHLPGWKRLSNDICEHAVATPEVQCSTSSRKLERLQNLH
jgi:hypothetical protein